MSENSQVDADLALDKRGKNLSVSKKQSINSKYSSRKISSGVMDEIGNAYDAGKRNTKGSDIQQEILLPSMQ